MTAFSQSHRSLPFLYLIIAILAVSCSAILIRMTHTPSLIIAFYRQAFSAVLILPFLKKDEEILSRRQYVLLTISGLFLALHFGTWITSLSYTSVARATLFVDLQPIWSALLGAMLLKERLGTIEIAGVALVTAGGAVTMGLHWHQPETSLIGDLLALIGGITGAGYFLIGRSIRTQISWVRYMYSVYYISSLWMLLFCLVLYRNFPFPDNRDLLWILLMALIPSLLGHGLLNVAVRRLKAYVVNSAFLGEPVLATLFAFLAFQERPDVYFYFGAAVIFCGLLLIFKKQTFEQDL